MGAGVLCGGASVDEQATACARGTRRAGAELLVLTYEWAVAHRVDRLDPMEAGKPGRERATSLDGPGTPKVIEFAATEFGARIERTSHHGRKLMAAALDLKLRLPLLWARVQTLEVRDSYAIHISERTRDLSADEGAEVDQAADGRIPWTHFELGGRQGHRGADGRQGGAGRSRHLRLNPASPCRRRCACHGDLVAGCRRARRSRRPC